MNKNKLIIITLCVFVILGIFLIVSQGKLRPTDLPAEKQSDEGAPVMTEGAKEELQEESYIDGISLKITSPQPNTTVSSSTLVVKGTTNPRAEVFINDTETKADANGNFVATITLDEGENAIIVVVNDDEGNSAEQQLLVTYQQ